jgi:hypothetical protein
MKNKNKIQWVFVLVMALFLLYKHTPFLFSHDTVFLNQWHMSQRYLVVLDYLADLTGNFVKKTGLMPSGKIKFFDAYVLLSKYVDEKDSPDLVGNIYDYICYKKSNDEDDFISLIENYRSWDIFRSTQGRPNNISGIIGYLNPENTYCLFESEYGKDDFLYIGIIIHEESVYKNNPYEREYWKILISMRENYYFAGSDGTPYKNGDVIMLRMKIKN